MVAFCMIDVVPKPTTPDTAAFLLTKEINLCVIRSGKRLGTIPNAPRLEQGGNGAIPLARILLRTQEMIHELICEHREAQGSTRSIFICALLATAEKIKREKPF